MTAERPLRHELPRRSWRVPLGRKRAREELAQHVRDGLAALERGDLDPAAQVRRDVDR